MTLKVNLKKTQAAKIIEEHFSKLLNSKGIDVLVSGREAGRRMVEIFRLLTNEMPQAPGIHIEFESNELPGLEFATPMERSSRIVTEVIPGFGGAPDILREGDHDGNKEIKLLEKGSKLLKTGGED